MIKLGFKTLQLFSIVLLALVFTAQAQRFTATMTCQRCTIACGVTFCYRIASARFDYESCPTKSCDQDLNRTFYVDKCNNDYDGSTCASKVCLYPVKNSGCASRKLNVTTCSATLQNLQFNCKACAAGSSCTNCLSLLTTAKPGVQQSNQCLGSTCNGVLSYPTVASYSTCKLDAFGYPCTCCFSLINYGFQMFGECLDNFPLWIGGGFDKYAINRTAWNASTNSTATTHEIFMMLSAALLMLMAILL